MAGERRTWAARIAAPIWWLVRWARTDRGPDGVEELVQVKRELQSLDPVHLEMQGMRQSPRQAQLYAQLQQQSLMNAQVQAGSALFAGRGQSGQDLLRQMGLMQGMQQSQLQHQLQHQSLNQALGLNQAGLAGLLGRPW